MKLAPMLAESTSHLTRRITAMNAPRPTTPSARVAVLALAAVASMSGGSLSSQAQARGPEYFMPKGAKPVKPVSKAVVLRYPDSLRNARVEGDVLVSFVVDTSGLVVSSSLRVLRSTHGLFTEAVRAAVAHARFIPAEMNGRKVRQLVQQPFFFDVMGSPASAARKPPPEARPTSDSTNTNPMMLRPMVITVP